MNCFAIVAQILHRKPFRHSGGFCTFSPSVTVTVQRYAVNPKLPTA
jgi:hypothetical protein